MEDQELHQIPQQISSYQFRLVGDMTLQQFFQVAIGAVIALILYSSNLPSYVKWPLVLLSFLTGVAFAFFPLEDRPLQKWVALFFKSIYSPTLFVWRQNPDMPDFFQKEEIALPQTPVQTTTGQEPVLKSTVPATSDPTAAPLPEFEKKEEELLTRFNKTLQGEAVAAPVQEDQKTTVTPTQGPPEIKKETEKSFEVPRTQQIEVEKTDHEVKHAQVRPDEPETSTQMTPIAAQPTIQKAKQAQFNQDAGPPMPPEKPNVVVGQVLGPEGEIVESAILEIKDKEGRPVRALKSNRLGHFMIVTPLANGEYEIITEKEGLDFDTIKLEAAGAIIPPIAVWANKSKQAEESWENRADQTQERSSGQQQEPTQETQETTGTEKTIYNQQG